MYSSVLLNTFGYLVVFIQATVGTYFLIQVRPLFSYNYLLMLCVFVEEKLQLLN